MSISDWSSDVCSSDLLPTDAALSKGAALIAEGRNRWWRFNAPVNGHRDYKATACPGRNLYSWLDELEDGPNWLDGPEFVAHPIQPLPPTLPTSPRDLLVDEIGRAHVCTTVPNAHLVCRHHLDKKH